MKFTKFKKTIISSLLVGLTLAGISYAATATPQQAYYDTFSFKVNGVVQYISDITKKPFIANSRVYVPISTLNDLGIAKAEWIPQNGGVMAELRVTPAGNTNSNNEVDKIAYYEQKFNELSTQIAQKDAKIKELEEANKKLIEEKSTYNKKDSKDIADSDDRNVKKQVSDLQYDMNKDRDFNRLSIGKSYLDVSYEFNFRRSSFEVKAYVKGLTSDDLKTIKESSSAKRDIENLLDDVADTITDLKGFSNVNVYLNMYDSSNGDREIGNYDYKDGRLRGSITLR